MEIFILSIVGRFKDHSSLPVIHLKARFVIVLGQFQIGAPSKQFSQRAIIELLPNKNRANYQFISLPPASLDFPRNIGHKAFVVVRKKWINKEELQSS